MERTSQLSSVPIITYGRKWIKWLLSCIWILHKNLRITNHWGSSVSWFHIICTVTTIVATTLYYQYQPTIRHQHEHLCVYTQALYVHYDYIYKKGAHAYVRSYTRNNHTSRLQISTPKHQTIIIGLVQASTYYRHLQMFYESFHKLGWLFQHRVVMICEPISESNLTSSYNSTQWEFNRLRKSGFTASAERTYNPC